MQVHDIPNSYGNQAPNRDYIQTVNLSRIPIQACRPWVCRVCHGTQVILKNHLYSFLAVTFNFHRRMKIKSKS